MLPPKITSFLVKVASRCNLNCDYCYVYHHADQSWKTMPKVLSIENRKLFVRRLAEYILQAQITRATVVFHGGEPLLAGAESLAIFASEIRAASSAEIDISLQTNGTLLSKSALHHLEGAGINISLSLDGPQLVNDKHRVSIKGLSTFHRTMEAFRRLEGRTSFSGVIAVIDPYTPPEQIFSFFSSRQLPNLDFLLPDAHHFRRPPGRDADQSLYERWLIRAFDIWIDQFPHLPVRSFEALLDVICGLPSRTDAFGFGDVSLISIETDGSYHDLDVLKITKDGATSLGSTMADTTIADIAASAPIAAHRRLLRKEGLCHRCQQCPIVDICAGGSLAHRFGPRDFDHPTVYCQEMLALVGHVHQRLSVMVRDGCLPRPVPVIGEVDLCAFERAESASDVMHELLARMHEDARREFIETVAHIDSTQEPSVHTILNSPLHIQAKLAMRPGAIAWRRVMAAQLAGRCVRDVDGEMITADSSYLKYLVSVSSDESKLIVGERDPWLRAPFGAAIIFERAAVVTKAQGLVDDALSIIQRWRPDLGKEMRNACRVIQLIRDPSAASDKIVSFSDNSVPGALYVSVVQGVGLIDPYDLADSLIHEHRHQKLYLLEKLFPLTETTDMLIESPWREDRRPPIGLIHAVFVFVELQRFWMFVYGHGPVRLKERAFRQLYDTNKRLANAFVTLKECPLTDAGKSLVSVLQTVVDSEIVLKTR